MTVSTRATLMLLVAVSAAPFRSGIRAEEGRDPSQPRKVVDSSMANRIHGAWNEIRRLQGSGRIAEAEALQRELAAGFFEDYLADPTTTPGQQALTTAFRMWGNTGTTDAIERAIDRIDRGSPLWSHLLLSARQAYEATGRLEDFRELTEGLARELTDPEAGSEVWIILGREYRAAGELDDAHECFQRVLEIAANPMFVDAAKLALREMDVLAPGRPAPDFEARSLDGRTIRLSSLRGKWVLLEFWSTTCAPCLPEIDHLREIRSEYPRKELELIGIALDQTEAEVRAVVSAKKLDWPQICDGRGAQGPVPSSYDVRGVPRSFLIDPQGRIAVKDARGDALDRALKALVEGTDENADCEDED